jgi:elongation factor P hydroxylase
MTDRHAARIAATFNRVFGESHRTRMVGGGTEPLYEPGTVDRPAHIVYTHDYPASALHEGSHWCLAGEARRGQRDYGYWYSPGPRDLAVRAAFFATECDVQAVEALFAEVCGVRFVVSADDFAAPRAELEEFERSVRRRIAQRRRHGLPRRAVRFRDALAAEFALG